MTTETGPWEIGVGRAGRWLPYATLAASTGLALLTRDEGTTHASVPVTLAVVAGAAGWLFVFVTMRPPWGRDRRIRLLFFAGLLVWIGLLIACSPLFGFFAWTGYLFIGPSLPGRRRILVGAASVAFFGATSQVGGFQVLAAGKSWLAFAVVLAFNVGIAVAMTALSYKAEMESERRKQTIVELAEANAKLAAAMRENAGLHAQLLTQAREAGVLDERQRMAGEIHDVLAQGLTGIVTQLEAADAATARPDDHRRHLDRARTLARDSLTEARRSVQALRPQPLAEAALPEALADVVDGWAKLNGVPVEMITTGTPQALRPEIETTLLRTAQEALANVARHAEASRVALTLSYMEDLVSLDVRDDGAGFDTGAPREASEKGGFGLAAMRERVQRIAGTLAVESEPGAGTAISACVPKVAAA